MSPRSNPNPDRIESLKSKGSLKPPSIGTKPSVAGMGTKSFAAKNAGSPGKLGKSSRLAETLSKLRAKGAAK